MRQLTATQIKRIQKGKKIVHLQLEPREGSIIRAIYDSLYDYIGRPVKLDFVPVKQLYSILRQLEIFYGLDIRNVGKKQFTLIGEWYGPIYVDYASSNKEELSLIEEVIAGLRRFPRERIVPKGVNKISARDLSSLRKTAAQVRKMMESEEPLPSGVHKLSQASIDSLVKNEQHYQSLLERHLKRS